MASMNMKLYVVKGRENDRCIHIIELVAKCCNHRLASEIWAEPEGGKDLVLIAGSCQLTQLKPIILFLTKSCNPESGQLGFASQDETEIERWLDIIFNQLEIPLRLHEKLQIDESFRSRCPNIPDALSLIFADMTEALHNINMHLLDNTFIVGERLSPVDICFFVSLSHPTMQTLMIKSDMISLYRWFHTVRHDSRVADDTAN